MNGLINKQNKESLIAQIRLNDGIISQLNSTRIAHENIFSNESRFLKRIDRQTIAFQEVVNTCIEEILEIMEREDLIK